MGKYPGGSRRRRCKKRCEDAAYREEPLSGRRSGKEGNAQAANGTVDISAEDISMGF